MLDTIEIKNEVPTYEIKIAIGLRVGYSEKVYSQEFAETIIQEYVDDAGFCVAVCPTRFIYTHGQEPGIIISIINYPRFPSNKEDLKFMAIELARKLMIKLEQTRCSVILPDYTKLLENKEKINGVN